ncbi:MAG: PHB depolymerase family esterase [Chloroflexota bacterium]
MKIFKIGCIFIPVLVLILLLGFIFVASGPSVGCLFPTNSPVEPGTSFRVLDSGGKRRCYMLYTPPGYFHDQPLPVVISLHGFASNPRGQQWFSEWNELADEVNFLVVYPQASSFPLRWNSSYGYSSTDTDDVQFFSDLIDQLSNMQEVDRHRIYVNGISNGGGMSGRIACELADKVAAIGSVAGFFAGFPGDCNPSRPVPVIAFHGTADPLVKYYGGTVSDVHGGTETTDPVVYPSFESWGEWWAGCNDCTSKEPLSETGEVRGIRYTNCQQNAEVVLYTIVGGGHTWPGGPSVPFIGETTQEIQASEVMWAFFEAHPLGSES